MEHGMHSHLEEKKFTKLYCSAKAIIDGKEHAGVPEQVSVAGEA